MKIDVFLILMIVSILVLSFFTYWNFKNLSKPLPELKTPKIEMPKPEEFFSPKKEIKEFSTPDGKLKLKYSSEWVEMPKEGWQETISSEGNILLFLTKFKIEKGAFASLVVQQLNWEKGIKELIEKMEEEAKEKGEMKVLSLEMKDKEATLKAKYKKENGNEIFLIAKEKIILLEERKVYLILIFSFEKFWPEFEGEANEILDSVEIIP